MEPFKTVTGVVVPIDRPNVDTDAIIPKQFLKSIKRTGFGQYLFDEWRYLDKGEADQDCSNRPLNKDFVLNQARYQGAEVLLARDNFGCGSSREHAVWALQEYGFAAVIAPSFADIFYNNCFKNGLLPIPLTESQIQSIFDNVAANPGYQLTVDLENNVVTDDQGLSIPFEVEPARRERMLQGLDDIAATLLHEEKITAFEEARGEAPVEA